MKTRTKPPEKFLVREWLERRTHAPEPGPPPSPADIQRELGWDLLKNNDEVERE